MVSAHPSTCLEQLRSPILIGGGILRICVGCLVCHRHRAILVPEGSCTPALKADRFQDRASSNRATEAV
jgi:hypothetical protein